MKLAVSKKLDPIGFVTWTRLKRQGGDAIIYFKGVQQIANTVLLADEEKGRLIRYMVGADGRKVGKEGKWFTEEFSGDVIIKTGPKTPINRDKHKLAKIMKAIGDNMPSAYEQDIVWLDVEGVPTFNATEAADHEGWQRVARAALDAARS